MVEVGTTNKTYLRDYAAAITEETALLMRVHASNYRITGFTHETTIEELVALGREQDIPVLDDLGSGTLLDTTAYGLRAEPMVQASIQAGVDLVCFSGDKLLGGPQAGIIVGRAELIERIKQFPMTRALRVDKITLAGLQATLLSYVRGTATQDIPVWRMIATPASELEKRARAWARQLRAAGVTTEVGAAESTVGGGSLPDETLPGYALAIRVESPDALAAKLHQSDPPLISRIEHDRLILDPRTVLPEQDQPLLNSLLAAFKEYKP
jgi:L-seryl-tRNA(Ser) seleniumtransferase